MNVFTRLDKSMVTGYLKQASSMDPEVVRTRFLDLKYRMELYRKLLLVPLTVGVLQLVVGTIGLIILVGVLLWIPGGFFAGGAWWARNRLRQNIVVAEAAYRDFYPATAPQAENLEQTA
jgi:hypothetical protein